MKRNLKYIFLYGFPPAAFVYWLIKQYRKRKNSKK